METLSFSSHLYNKLETVLQHSIQRRKGFEEFIQLLSERASHEESYARGLERIGSHPYFASAQGTLGQAVCAMKNDSLNRAMQSRILAENITNDLIEPMRVLWKEQVLAIKLPIQEGKRIERQKQMIIERLDKSKIRYWKACNDCEQATKALEKHSNKKHVDKLIDHKREIDLSLKHYAEALNTYNNFIQAYTETVTGLLSVFQSQEEQRLLIMKDSLRKLVIYDTACLRNLQYDIDNMAHSMENINTRSDIESFIKEHLDKKSLKKLQAEEFIPYEGSHPSFKNIGMNPPLITMPPPQPQPEPAPVTETPITELHIENIFASVFNGDDYDKAQISSIVKTPLGKKTVLGILSSKSSSPLLTDATYDELTGIMVSLLSDSERTKDVTTIRTLMMLSQTFYKEGPEFLVNSLLQHPLWRDFEVWELLIQSSIDDEILAQKEFGFPEETEAAQLRIKNIVFVQLGSFANILITYKVDVRYASEILSKYACKYELPGSDIDTLMAILNKTESSEKKDAITSEVLRGVPEWLQDADGVHKKARKLKELDN